MKQNRHTKKRFANEPIIKNIISKLINMLNIKILQ